MDEHLICVLCGEPIFLEDKTDEGNYGLVHHNCPDTLVIDCDEREPDDKLE